MISLRHYRFLLVPQMYNILFILWFGFLNCARGRLLFNLTTSTEIARIATSVGMGIATTILTQNIVAGIFTAGALLLWMTPAWDVYWSAEIGNDPKHSRLWGLGAMTIRMSLAIPCLAGLAAIFQHSAWPIAGAVLLSVPYYISGYISPKKYIIPIAEFAVGALLGILIHLIVV